MPWGQTLRRLSFDEEARLQSFPASFSLAEEGISEKMADVGIGNDREAYLSPHA